MAKKSIFEIPGLWRLVTENVFDGVMFVDPEQRVLHWNSQAMRITGYAAEDVVGQSCLVGVRCPNCLKQCGLFLKGEICERTVPIITRSGREILVIKNGIVVRGARGKVLGGIEVFRRLSSARGLAAATDEAGRLRVALDENRWSREATARALGISRATLWRRMRRLGMQ